MRMPGQALHHLVIVRRRLQAGTRGELSDRAAIDLLPGRLVLQRGRRVGLAARGDLRVAEQQVDAPVVEVDAHAVAGLDEGEAGAGGGLRRRSEERTSELQSLMRTSYAVFSLKKKNRQNS